MTRLTDKAAIVIGWFALTSCGASFKAVDATGKLGQKIDGSIAQTAPAQLCADLSALAPQLACPKAGKWGDVADAMVAYAAKLSALASKDDVDPSDAISSSLSAASDAKLSQLSTDQNGAIANFAKSVVQAMSMAYRAEVLTDVIERVDPHLQLVGTSLVNETKIRIGQIESLESVTRDVQSTLGSTAPRPSVPAPSPAAAAAGAPAATVAMGAGDPKLAAWIEDQEAINQVTGQVASIGAVLLLQDLSAKRRAYVELRANVTAFCAAHAQLVKRSHDLNAKDLLPQIIAIAKSAAALRDHFKGGTSEAAKN